MSYGDSKLDRKPVASRKVSGVEVAAGDFSEHLVVKAARPSMSIRKHQTGNGMGEGTAGHVVKACIPPL